MIRYKENVFKRIGHEQSRNDGFIVVTKNEKSVLLNYSTSAVWEYLDGYLTIDSIYKNMLEKYGKDNSPENIQQVLENSIDILLKYKLIEKLN